MVAVPYWVSFIALELYCGHFTTLRRKSKELELTRYSGKICDLLVQIYRTVLAPAVCSDTDVDTALQDVGFTTTEALRRAGYTMPDMRQIGINLPQGLVEDTDYTYSYCYGNAG